MGGGGVAGDIFSQKLTTPALTAYEGFTVRSGGVCGCQVQPGSFSQMEKLKHRKSK